MGASDGASVAANPIAIDGDALLECHHAATTARSELSANHLCNRSGPATPAPPITLRSPSAPALPHDQGAVLCPLVRLAEQPSGGSRTILRPMV